MGLLTRTKWTLSGYRGATDLPAEHTDGIPGAGSHIPIGQVPTHQSGAEQWFPTTGQNRYRAAALGQDKYIFR